MSDEFWNCCHRQWDSVMKFCGKCGRKRPEPTAEVGEEERKVKQMFDAFAGALEQPVLEPWEECVEQVRNAWRLAYAKAREICGEEAAELRAECKRTVESVVRLYEEGSKRQQAEIAELQKGRDKIREEHNNLYECMRETIVRAHGVYARPVPITQALREAFEELQAEIAELKQKRDEATNMADRVTTVNRELANRLAQTAGMQAEIAELGKRLKTERAMKEGCQHWLVDIAGALNELGVGHREDENTAQRAMRILREQQDEIAELKRQLAEKEQAVMPRPTHAQLAELIAAVEGLGFIRHDRCNAGLNETCDECDRLERAMENAKAGTEKEQAAQSGLPGVGECVEVSTDEGPVWRRVCGHGFFVLGPGSDREFHSLDKEGQCWRRGSVKP